MKLKNYIYILILMGGVGIFSLLSGMRKTSSGKVSEEELVALVPNAGFEILSENPVKLSEVRNGTVRFKVQLNKGYFYTPNEGVTYVDECFVFDNITEPGNLYVTLGHMCNITIGESANGVVELTGSSVVTNGGRSSIKITPNEHYMVDYIMVGSDRYPAPAGDEFEFVVDDDCQVDVYYTSEVLTFMAMSNGLGEIKISNQTEQYHYGDVIGVSCNYDNENIQFQGWSVGGYLADGGNLLSEAPSYEYTITENTVLYANFKDITAYNVIIDPNGGSLAASLDILECSPYTNISLPVDNNVLSRPGCTLVGYNTMADGSGAFYSLGGMLNVPKSNLTLYAQWIEQTPQSAFTYGNDGASVVITGLNDRSLTTICIPTVIDGVPVRSIAANAFRDADQLVIAVIPIGVTVVDSGAFAGCDNLKQVYLPESLEGLAEDAFSQCPNFTSIRVLPYLDKVYDYDYDSAMADKYMKLKNTEGKRIILVGGSSLTFGLDSALIKDAFSNYEVINFSCSFLYGMLPVFDLLRNNVHEGDIVIFAPEYYEPMYAVRETITMANWQYLESNYGILDDLNIKNNPIILNSFTNYLNKKRGLLPGKLVNADSVYVRSGINGYGDLTVYRENRGVFEPELPQISILTDVGMGNYNNLCKELSQKGASCLFSFPPLSMGSSTRDYLVSASQNFVDTLRAKLDSNYCTIISDFSGYLFEPQYFFDNFYHLTLDGAVLRTNQIIADLKNWGLEG